MKRKLLPVQPAFPWIVIILYMLFTACTGTRIISNSARKTPDDFFIQAKGVTSPALNNVTKIKHEIPKSRYKENKKKYDYRTYTYQKGDPIKPIHAECSCLLLPGLGQMLCGEPGRGFAFLGGYSACFTLMTTGYAFIWIYGSESYCNKYSNPCDDNYNPGLANLGIAMFLAGLTSTITVYWWSVIDAGKVAKVNNLAFRDKNKTTLNIEPFINPLYNDLTGKIIPGIGFKLTF
jgi:hypothetical protein